jgi:hypothetical protein
MIIEAMADDLHQLKDDMNAFILGHGLTRFSAYIGDDMHSVLWETDSQPDSWKDFVELAKACNVHFVTFSDDKLEKEDLDFLMDRLQNSTALDDELDEARWLRSHIGKVGFIQLGFPYQGTMFLYEVSADWYDRYQALLDSADDFGSIILDERDQRDDDER